MGSLAGVVLERTRMPLFGAVCCGTLRALGAACDIQCNSCDIEKSRCKPGFVSCV